MSDPEHLAILRKGVSEWNLWRQQHPAIVPDLSGVHFHIIFYQGLADESRSRRHDPYWRDGLGLASYPTKFDNSRFPFERAVSPEAVKASFRAIDLRGARLSRASLGDCDLSRANLSGAHLDAANLGEANLHKADLTGADLRNANLERADLIETDLRGADLTGARVYGISAWNLRLETAKQTDLVITPSGEAIITVDNLEIAQFVYLLLNNDRLRLMIDTLATKAVLVLGRFTAQRKAVLDAIREELRRRGYLPILFDFEKPVHRDFTETVMTLASLSRFVIADLSDPNSIPHELMAFAEKLPSIPVKPIFCATAEHQRPYPLIEHLQRYQHVLETYSYDTGENLIAALVSMVIEPAEAKVSALRPKRSDASG